MKHTLAVSLFLTILAGNTTGNAMARNTTISGVAPSYAGKTISLRTYAEQVLNEEEELAQAKVEKDGAFKFEVNIDSPIQVFIPNDVTKAFIYLLLECKPLIINTPRKPKQPKETNWKQKFQKPKYEYIR